MKMIRILGAGLSGLTAAINLAKEGYEVEVFEKNDDCGKRFNGDFQGLENTTSNVDILNEMKSMNIKTDFFYEPFNSLQRYGPSMKKTTINSRQPMFYLVKRGSTKECLDASLKRRAIDLGVKIYFNKSMHDSKMDIIATGPKRVSGIVKGITFRTSLPKLSIIIYNNNIAPKAYAYFLSSQGNATLATMITRDFKNSNIYLNKAIKVFHDIVDFDDSGARYFCGYGNWFTARNYESNGSLMVGEAAGLQDFLFGFGMRYAMVSGFLAARSIIDGTSYNSLIKNRFGKQLTLSRTKRLFFEIFGNRIYDLLLKNRRFNKFVGG
jgi:flavin-dependent dehydrogenase